MRKEQPAGPKAMPSKATQTIGESEIILGFWKNRKLSPHLAKEFLKIDFKRAQRERMRELMDKNTEGQITPGELDELDAFIRIGFTISILQSRSRRVLGIAPPKRRRRG
jgi:hypothetical protein